MTSSIQDTIFSSLDGLLNTPPPPSDPLLAAVSAAMTASFSPDRSFADALSIAKRCGQISRDEEDHKTAEVVKTLGALHLSRKRRPPSFEPVEPELLKRPCVKRTLLQTFRYDGSASALELLKNSSIYGGDSPLRNWSFDELMEALTGIERGANGTDTVLKHIYEDLIFNHIEDLLHDFGKMDVNKLKVTFQELYRLNASLGPSMNGDGVDVIADELEKFDNVPINAHDLYFAKVAKMIFFYAYTLGEEPTTIVEDFVEDLLPDAQKALRSAIQNLKTQIPPPPEALDIL